MRLAVKCLQLSCCYLMLLPMIGCAQPPSGSATKSSETTTQETKQTGNSKKAAATEDQAKKEKKMEVATFAGGCFWCTEAVFLQLKGVSTVKSGYMGGRTANPTYKDICTGTTGHAEVIQIEYDPAVVSFDVLLQVFWKTHDPTTLNRQGNDVGTQYRSAVFYHNDTQKQKADEYKKKLNDVKAYPNPIVTEITAASKFYVAEDYHQNYYSNNPNQGYCRAMIPPKLEKLRKVFGDKLKVD